MTNELILIKENRFTTLGPVSDHDGSPPGDNACSKYAPDN